MNILVVSPEHLAPIGHQLVHAISTQRGLTAEYWNVGQYNDNKSGLPQDQPLIFLGVTESHTADLPDLPEKFRGYGTRCFVKAPHAKLVADLPPRSGGTWDLGSVKKQLKELEKAVAQLPDDFWMRSKGSMPMADKLRGLGKDVLMGFGKSWSFPGIVFVMPPPFQGQPVLAIQDEMRLRKHLGLQYDYLLGRFFGEEFDAWIAALK